MSHHRQQIDAIKEYFAEYSSAQLHAIAQSTDSERWSAEALVAAHEILLDREAGRAQEPLIAKTPEPLPPSLSDSFYLGVGALAPFSLLAGFAFTAFVANRIAPRVDHAGSADPDLPVPFGPKMTWLALDTTDTEAVATALGLQGARAATWAEGIHAAHHASVFVTPPLADWTLAVSTGLFPPDRAEAFVKPLLERLSRQFGDAQYFCTHRDVGLHMWARARKGRLVRGFGWLGQKRLTLWDEGAQTKEERDLGFQFGDEHSITVEQTQNKSASLPDEGCVMQLAYLWSIDPTTLDGQFKEPVLGLLGTVAGGESGISR
jgi:hypothetical protein